MFYMQVSQDENIVSGSIPSHAEVESQPQVLNLKYAFNYICWPSPPQGTCIFVDIGISNFSYMLLYMQAPTDAQVLEEHQTGAPPVTHEQVCDCRSLSLYVCVHISRSSNIQYVSLIWTCNMFYMQVAQDEYIVSGSIPSHAEVDSQP